MGSATSPNCVVGDTSDSSVSAVISSSSTGSITAESSSTTPSNIWTRKVKNVHNTATSKCKIIAYYSTILDSFFSECRRR